MKHLGFYLSLLAVSVLYSCTHYGPRKITYPQFEGGNTSSIAFTEIELTDSATIASVQANYRPNYWIRIAPESRLKADGKEYKLIGTEGIDPGKEFWIPESGKAQFKLIFEPLPFETTSVDFDEGENITNGFALWGIDLTGKADYNKPSPDIPKELLAEPADGELPLPVMKADSATINIHLANYNPAIGDSFEYIVNNYTEQRSDLLPIKVDSEGNATLKLMLYGMSQIALWQLPNAVFWAAPGETMDVYYDCRSIGRNLMSDMEMPGFKANKVAVYHNGKYRDLDYLSQQHQDKRFKIDMYRNDFADYHMTGTEYTDHVIKTYNELRDSLNSTPLPNMIKEMWEVSLQADLLRAITYEESVLIRNYYHTNHKNWGDPIRMDSLNWEISSADIARVASLIDFENPKLLIEDSGEWIMNCADFWLAHGIKSDQLSAYSKYSSAYKNAIKAEMTDEELNGLKALKDPFYADAAKKRQQETLDALAKADMSLVQATPDVADDKIFDAIIAPHKGKVVMVDLWNTWCGPCRAALNVNEPEKSGDLASDDIVWIYIADESSPIAKYTTMIPEIKGLHYRLSGDQMRTIDTHFNVDGIPFYILVDRNGKATGRPDLRDHDKFKKTLLEEVEKK